MRPEYNSSTGQRGTYAARLANLERIVVLDPHVAQVFPTSRSVNDALRQLAAERKRKAGSKRPRSGGT